MTEKPALTDLDQVHEQDLISALERRGWRFKQVRIPVGHGDHSPTYLTRQLQHSGKPE